jgi:YD repeat-containing protein
VQSLQTRLWPRLLLAALGYSLLAAPVPSSAQQPAINYVYDDLSRLIAVVDQRGNAATYTYDAVGNILKIERVDAAGIPGAVGITLVSPNRGKVGTTVQIFGKGFSGTPSQNTVAFNGTAATVAASAFNRIVTSVPEGAVTGPITVTTPLGSATSPTPFTVVGSIAIDPATTALLVNGTQQFTATEAGTETPPPVRWSVNDIAGGDSTVGTISTEGLYTAPANVPAAGLTVTVTATHTDDPTVIASATVTIRPPQPAFVAARGVSVQFIDRAVNQNVTTIVSVQVAEAGLRPVIAPGVGVQFFGADPVTAIADSLGVNVAAADAFSGVSQVSVALEPVIALVSPSGGAPGAVELSITITGSGLSGATRVSFLVNSAPDANITVTNLAVTADGTQATAQISISSTAALGPRVVQITTPAGTSTTAGAGGNVFTVQ